MAIERNVVAFGDLQAFGSEKFGYRPIPAAAAMEDQECDLHYHHSSEYGSPSLSLKIEPYGSNVLFQTRPRKKKTGEWSSAGSGMWKAKLTIRGPIHKPLSRITPLPLGLLITRDTSYEGFIHSNRFKTPRTRHTTPIV